MESARQPFSDLTRRSYQDVVKVSIIHEGSRPQPCDPLTLRTVGMGHYGSAELEMRGVSPLYLAMALAILNETAYDRARGMGQRLGDVWPGPAVGSVQTYLGLRPASFVPAGEARYEVYLHTTEMSCACCGGPLTGDAS